MYNVLLLLESLEQKVSKFILLIFLRRSCRFRPFFPSIDDGLKLLSVHLENRSNKNGKKVEN